MDKVDTITVSVDLERKVYASRADMYVEIREDSLVSGNAALKKAREVRDLVTALASLTRLDWQYNGMEELHDEMLGQALRRAEQRAALICRELNHGNLGVHRLTESLRDDQEKREQRHVLSDVTLGMRSTGAVSKQELGLDVSHAKTVSLNVRVEYHVQPQPQAEHAAAADG